MKKILILFLLILLIIFPGCINKKQDKLYYSFIDSSNNEIKLNNKPKNVAILISSFVEIYNIAGGSTNITIQEAIDRNLVSNDVILVDDGAGKTINTEILISSNPDFVIGSLDISEQAKTCAFLNDLGIPSALFKVECFEDYLFVLNILTDITNNKQNYQEYGLNIKKNIDNLKQKIKITEEKPKILFIRSGSSSSSCKAKNKQTNFVCEMLDELGVINIADTAIILLDGLSIEEILLNEPDYIFVSIMGNYDNGKKFILDLFNTKTYQSLKAVKNNQFYFLPKDLFQYKPNHKWDIAYQYLVDILYEEK